MPHNMLRQDLKKSQKSEKLHFSKIWKMLFFKFLEMLFFLFFTFSSNPASTPSACCVENSEIFGISLYKEKEFHVHNWKHNYVPQWWVESVVYQQIKCYQINESYNNNRITESLGRIWLFSEKKIKSSESFSKQPTQLIIAVHNCHMWLCQGFTVA